jgi:phage terminase large subunit GpA-like protein
MIAGIIFIIVIASALYFFDDFPKWIESIKKFWNDIPTLYDRNIRTKPKLKQNTPEYDKEALKIQQQQMNEAKKGFQEILNSRKPQGYGQDLYEKLTRFEEQLDSRNKSKSMKGHYITAWERKFLWKGISQRKRVPCIHCETEDMYRAFDGPLQTWHCPRCGQGVTLSFNANTMAGFKCENLGINQDWIKNNG